MAKDMAGVIGEVSMTFNDQDAVVLRQALRMYVASKKRACNAAVQDGELYPVYNGQMIRGASLLQKFGG